MRSLPPARRATIRGMRDITVTRATTEDWGAIEAMRTDHYERMGAERIPVPGSACWHVALCGADVVACCAVMEGQLNGTVLCVTDFYCEQTRRGRDGVTRLLNDLEKRDARLVGSMPVWNKPMLNALARRGYYPTEITMEKDNRVRAH